MTVVNTPTDRRSRTLYHRNTASCRVRQVCRIWLSGSPGIFPLGRKRRYTFSVSADAPADITLLHQLEPAGYTPQRCRETTERVETGPTRPKFFAEEGCGVGRKVRVEYLFVAAGATGVGRARRHQQGAAAGPHRSRRERNASFSGGRRCAEEPLEHMPHEAR